MDVADPRYLLHTLRRRWLGGGANYNNERCAMMNSDQAIDVLSIKLERVHVLADILFSLLVDNPQAQILTEIIMETSLLSKG
jgi:hypothetical protein